MPRDRHHDELRDAIARLERVRRALVGIEQDHLDLAAVSGVEGARGVDDREAVLRGESAARDDEPDVAVGKGDGGAGADEGALARPQFDRLRRRSVGSGVTRMRVLGNVVPGEQHLDVGHATRLAHGRMGACRASNPVWHCYRERLWPAPWVFIATALVIPASLLVFLPISLPAGIAVAVGLYAAIVVVLIATTATIEVTADDVPGRPGAHRARLHRGRDRARGQECDGRARRAARCAGLAAGARMDPGLVRVELGDPQDPTPYWLVATRHPDAAGEGSSSLERALVAARARAWCRGRTATGASPGSSWCR